MLIEVLIRLNKKKLATSYFPAEGSIIGVRELDFRVRNGNGYYLSTMATGIINNVENEVRKTNNFVHAGQKYIKEESFVQVLMNGNDDMAKSHDLLVMLG